jgi:DNA recombination protein RmuC
MEPHAILYALLGLSILSLLLTAIVLVRGARQSAAPSRVLQAELRDARAEQANQAKALREEVTAAGKSASDTQLLLIRELRESQLAQFEGFSARIAASLEDIRATVDEKLHQTLERRLGESFALVSERLEAVQRGLGEMQSLASGVGDLKRVLTGVRTRGVWGEYQLEAILQEILTPDQYCANYRPGDDAGDMVEFAVRFPGRDDSGSALYMPIDAKFPQQDYHRLLDAVDRADPEGVREASAGLARAVRGSAREISEKYIRPPATTDFAIMFLPTEGLYAEVLRQPGLVQDINRQYSVILAGPTTLAAILSSLRMGFRTLAIQQRSSEVWRVLGAVKAEFAKFGSVLDKLKKQLNTASNTVDESERRTRMMARRLREVEELPPELAREVVRLVGEAPGTLEDEDDEEGSPEAT